MPPLMAAITPMLASIGIGSATTAATAGSIGLMEAGAAGVSGVALSAGLPSTLTAAATGGGLLSTLGTVAGLAGTGLSMFGQAQAGNQEAAILQVNADIARTEGKSIQEATKAETLRVSRDRRKLIGEQANAIGGAGIDFSGSPLDVMANTAGDFERDIAMLGAQGDAQANARFHQASIYDWMAPQRRRAGYLGALGTGLKGAGMLASSRLAFA